MSIILSINFGNQQRASDVSRRYDDGPASICIDKAMFSCACETRRRFRFVPNSDVMRARRNLQQTTTTTTVRRQISALEASAQLVVEVEVEVGVRGDKRILGRCCDDKSLDEKSHVRSQILENVNTRRSNHADQLQRHRHRHPTHNLIKLRSNERTTRRSSFVSLSPVAASVRRQPMMT